MRSTFIIAMIVLVGTIPFAASPIASADHFSVGGEDGVAVQASEDIDNPSVCDSSARVGCDDAADDADSLWNRGIRTDCPDDYTGTTGNLASEAGTVATRDPFCGQLQYNLDTDFARQSPVDQDYPNNNPFDLQFDAVMTNNAGNYGLGWCPPWWCFGATAQVFQNTGNDLGITDDYDTYESNAGGSYENQGYSVDLKYPNAAQVVSSTSGLYEANGWVAPTGDRSIVAFLTTTDTTVDTNGDGNVDNNELKDLVAGLKASGDMPPGTTPQVCAFTAEASISIGAGDTGFCEVDFSYIKDTSDGSLYWDDYGERCGSPTYVCGTVTEAWYANLVMLPLFAYGAILNPANGVSESTFDYDTWHFVVAPNSQDQCTNAEPGFDLDSDGTTYPYLAHDLDIFEQALSPAGVDQTENAIDLWVAADDEHVDPVQSFALGIGTEDVIQALPDPIQYTVSKDDLIEPNAAGDSSQSLADDSLLQRTAGNDPCAVFQNNNEEHFDPWVDYIDSQADVQVPFTAELDPLTVDPAADQSQDSSNADFPSFYDLNGQIGMFTDKNDDGDYDQADGESVTDDIDSVGAYPLLFDMRVTEENGTLVPDTESGCIPGYGNTRISGIMADAGYGPRTGLIQVVYLEEETVLFHEELFVSQEYLTGGNAFVFTSQAIRAHLAAGDQTVQAALDNALSKLPTTPNDVIFPGDKESVASDYVNQCRADTGAFDNNWYFLHHCATGCAGDTIVTSYVLDVTSSDGGIGGQDLPDFTDVNGDRYDFETADAGYIETLDLVQWFDVDPFDGDNSRSTGGSPPPTGE